MNYPKLRAPETSRQMADTFKGYNHNPRISDGEFFDMKNMTSEHYPVLSPRDGRSVRKEASAGFYGVITKDALCWLDGTDFYINDWRAAEMGGLISTAEDMQPKQLISMGAYVIILPDKVYINTLDYDDMGEIECHWEHSAASIYPCTLSGKNITYKGIGDEAPEEPDNLDYWLDTSGDTDTLRQWSESAEMWVSVPTSYVRIEGDFAGSFAQYDGITISGCDEESLNTSAVIWSKADGYIVIGGLLRKHREVALTIRRTMPEMDHICEAGNRLWGCKYGMVDGKIVNEIYASKLGDFKNWNCFMGIASDSWAGSVGSDGQFTGAITHLGYPCFFKENILHKVYISPEGAHQIQDTACRGVRKGCGRSLAIVDEVLYYKARSGVMAYDGGLPAQVGYALGNEDWGDAVACGCGNKYYISMGNNDMWNLFVYDAAKGFWHREDDLRVLAMTDCDGAVYAITDDRSKIVCLTKDDGTETVSWMAQSGPIGLSMPDMKYITRLILRLQMASGSTLTVKVRYDQDELWEPVCTLRESNLRSFSLPIRPRRCDHMYLLLEGEGAARLYSITKVIEQGSDLS